jgi:hypothetical protein
MTLTNQLGLAQDILEALAARYSIIRPLLPRGVDHQNDRDYDGHRTSTEQVIGYFGRVAIGRKLNYDITSITPETVKNGDVDHLIVDSFMDRASAEYHYRFLKRWD